MSNADALNYEGSDTLSMQIRELREQREILRTKLVGRYDGHQDANDRAQDLLGEALWHIQFAIMQAQIQFFLLDLDEEFGPWSGGYGQDELSAGEYRFVFNDNTWNKSYRIEIRATDDVTYSMVKKFMYDFILDGCSGPNEDGTEWDEGFSSHGFVNIYKA